MAAQPGAAEGTKAEPTASAPFSLPPRPRERGRRAQQPHSGCSALFDSLFGKKVGLFKEDPLCDVLYMEARTGPLRPVRAPSPWLMPVVNVVAHAHYVLGCSLRSLRFQSSLRRWV